MSSRFIVSCRAFGVLCASFAIAIPTASLVLSVVAAQAEMRIAQAQPDLNGVWRGTFTNMQGASFPVTYTLSAADGKVTGTADIPSSSVDPRPKITGTVEGNRVVLILSSGFRSEMTLNAEGNRMTGSTTGANMGSLALAR